MIFDFRALVLSLMSMSLLSDFSSLAFDQASRVIGTDTIAIDGGDAVSVVSSEPQKRRDSELGGFDPSNTASVVCDTSDFSTSYVNAVETYLGKLATYQSEVWRVESISKGQSFVTISLISGEDVA